MRGGYKDVERDGYETGEKGTRRAPIRHWNIGGGGWVALVEVAAEWKEGERKNLGGGEREGVAAEGFFLEKVGVILTSDLEILFFLIHCFNVPL